MLLHFVPVEHVGIKFIAHDLHITSTCWVKGIKYTYATILAKLDLPSKLKLIKLSLEI